MPSSVFDSPRFSFECIIYRGRVRVKSDSGRDENWERAERETDSAS